jgi:hypothetical protein
MREKDPRLSILEQPNRGDMLTCLAHVTPLRLDAQVRYINHE